MTENLCPGQLARQWHASNLRIRRNIDSKLPTQSKKALGAYLAIFNHTIFCPIFLGHRFNGVYANLFGVIDSIEFGKHSSKPPTQSKQTLSAIPCYFKFSNFWPKLWPSLIKLIDFFTNQYKIPAQKKINKFLTAEKMQGGTG